MSVLSRSALESSPLADLHEIASELGMDSYRRLRKADLVAAIVQRQGGDPGDPGDAGDPAEEATEVLEVPEGDAEGDAPAPARSRSRRGGRGRSRARDRDEDREEGSTDEDAGPPERAGTPERAPRRSRSAREDRGGREDRGERGGGREQREDRGPKEDKLVTGTVELLANGSGFVRVNAPETSDDDVYVSAAQVRRCELVAGDAIAGPLRPPRRSERYPSLVRVDTINGRSADEVSEGTKFEDLPAAYPTERLAIEGDDPTLKAIAWLTPVGRGSRAVIAGAPRAGKTEALRRLAGALAGQEGLELSVVLAGVRPEEIGEWKAGPVEPVAAVSFAVPADVQGQAVERAVETAKRLAARGGHAVVLIDSLEHVPAPVARKALAAARNIVDGGSLTIIATAPAPVGGESTVIALDVELASAGRFPALDLPASGTLRPELLVGEKGAEAITEARAQALG